MIMIVLMAIKNIKYRNEIKRGDVIQQRKKIKSTSVFSSGAENLTFVAFVGDDQQCSIEMRYENENIWLTQKKMVTLYDVSVAVINQHIKKIYNKKL